MKNIEIIRALKENRKLSGYEFRCVEKDSRELFYVLDHLEINRAVETVTQSAKVYVSQGVETTGSSTVVITAADNARTLKQKINNAVSQAKQAKNQFYPLAEKTENIKDINSRRVDLNEVATKVAKAVLNADHYKNGWINSTEIFVSQYKEELFTSNKIHHVSSYLKIEIECIPTWSNGEEEFELYKFYESNKIDYKGITEEIEEILNLAKDRSEAKTLKDVDIPEDVKVLVKNDMLQEIVGNFKADLSYRNVYMRQNHYKVNDIVSDNPFDLTLKPSINGCAASRKFDSNGVVLKNRTLIKDGKVKDYNGDVQFGFYLGEEDVTGNIPNIELKAEGINYKRDKHIIIETFSSPQLEDNSGYWGGEVRLARYYDGKKYIPLTGFSISGNIYEDIRNVEFSKEQSILSNYKGPKYMIFKGLKIS